METKVINLFGAPGAGKTTLAAGIFAEMKKRQINCELVTEFAKRAAWEKRDSALRNEILLFAQKHHELFVLQGQVQYIIIDSPLLLTTVYNTLSGKVDNLNALARSEHDKFDNINIFILNNTNAYDKRGRIHEQEELKEIEHMLTSLYYEISTFGTLYATKEYNVEKIVDRILGVE